MECDVWYHKSCISMCTKDFDNIGDVTWICAHCNTPNYSDSLYHSYELDMHNHYDILARLNDTSMNSSFTSVNTDVFNPNLISTPQSINNASRRRQSSRSSHATGNMSVSSKPHQSGLQNKNNNFRVMVVNTNGCKDKSAILETAVNYINPDAILATESKLSSEVKAAEFLPEGYRKNLLRKDRNSKGGGVFVATKDHFIVTPVTNSDTNCESVWANVSLPQGRNLKLCSFYQPPKTGADPVNTLSQSVSDIGGNDLTLVAGDFNCPGINWENNSIAAGSPEMAGHEAVIEFQNDHQLTQVQHEPTRAKNCLDLFFTSNPSLVKSTNVVPGISDHDIIVIDTDIRPTIAKSAPHTAYNYKRADWFGIKAETNEFAKTFAELAPTRSVEANWDAFKEHMRHMQEKYVPSSRISPRKNPPYFTRRLRRMTRKKQDLFNKTRGKSRSSQAWIQYRQFQKQTEKAIKTAQWEYIRDKPCQFNKWLPPNHLRSTSYVFYWEPLYPN